MNHLKLMQKLLKERRDFEDLPEFDFPFVTISRQAGAGAHLLSYVLLSEFLKHRDNELFEGWHVFDKQLCDAIEQDPVWQNTVEALATEEYHSEFTDFLESLFTGKSKQYAHNKSTFRVVRMLAQLGKVILVGRCSSLVTLDLPRGIHIRLVAPHAQRVAWMMKRFKYSRDQARDVIDKQDSDRRKLVKLFFQRDVEDPLLYDAIWNTSRVDMETICHSTVEMIESRGARKRKASSVR